MSADYDARLTRVEAYIADHLDDYLDTEDLAEVAGLSPYHWHRVYHARRGETIGATVARLRLERAAGLLAETSTGIVEVAEQCGYGSLPAFTRAFERAYGMPPARYRLLGSRAPQAAQPAPDPMTPHAVRIESRPTAIAVTLTHRGTYLDIGRSFDTLLGWLGARDLLRPGMRSVTLYYDDPASVVESDLEARVGVIAPEPIDVEWPLELTEIAARDYAVLTHVGPYSGMPAAYQWLYGEWLPSSGRWPANEPVFEEYVNDAQTTPVSELETLICLPLTAAGAVSSDA